MFLFFTHKMNFKEESISINETISKLLESSNQDINVNIKQKEEVKEEKVEQKRMNLKELVKLIEEEKRKKDEEARQYYEKLRKDSYTQINVNNSAVIPPPSFIDVKKNSIIQVSNNHNNNIKEEKKIEYEKEQNEVPVTINNQVEEKKSSEKEEKKECINKETKKEESKPIVNDSKKKPKMISQKTMTHKKVDSLITNSNKVTIPITKYNTMKSKTPVKQRVKTPDKLIPKKEKEVKKTIPPLKIKQTHVRVISTDASIDRTRNITLRPKHNKEMSSITEYSKTTRNINDSYSPRKERTRKIVNNKIVLSKITKNFYERQLSFEKKKKAKREKLAEELKRKEEEELTKNIKLTKEGFKNKMIGYKEWEEKKQNRINQLMKEQELQQLPNKKYTKKEINETINRLYKDDMNKKKYIIQKSGAIYNSNKKRKYQTEYNTRKGSFSNEKSYKPYITNTSKNE